MFLSNSNIVIPPANTGSDNNNNIAVTNRDHTYKGIKCNVKPGDFILKIVDMKFIAPNNEDTPAKCKLKIAKSTAPPEWNSAFDSGGYTVHPVPTPCSTKAELSNSVKDGTNNQNEILFNLGKLISGAPIIIGKNQFPNPPIKIGIIKKNIIITP
jgi:hypothetical protein|tara:strand:- start:386 stop:850 length:465 start_codon:yes stop_codon:yes gene_type:complete